MYVALRTLNIGDGKRLRGQPVPEAVEWRASVVQALIRQGHMRDMGEEEAAQMCAVAEGEGRMSEIKRAQKKRRKARMKLDVVLAKIDSLERALKPLRETSGGYELGILEAEEALTKLDALDIPDEKPSRVRKHEMRTESINRARDAARGRAEAEEIAKEEAPKPGSDAHKLRIRLSGHTRKQLYEMAEERWIDLDSLDDRPKKPAVVEHMAKAIEAIGPEDNGELLRGRIAGYTTQQLMQRADGMGLDLGILFDEPAENVEKADLVECIAQEVEARLATGADENETATGADD